MEVVDITENMFCLVGTPGVDGLSVEQVCPFVSIHVLASSCSSYRFTLLMIYPTPPIASLSS